MHLVVFTHSLVSDWNHGNTHFLRGVIRALHARGHSVETFEPSDGWSLQRLLGDHGLAAALDFASAFPDLEPKFYDPTYERFAGEPLEAVLDRADAVLMHEWNHPAFVARLGRQRRARGNGRGDGPAGFQLLFHDTHHRAATAPAEMSRYDLTGYDGVLAFGAVIRDLYLKNGWTDRAWVWHEAADVSLFHPPTVPVEPTRDLIWVGNWGGRGADGGTARVPARPGAGPGALRPRARRALPGRGPRGAGRRRDRLRRLAAEPSRARRVRPRPGSPCTSRGGPMWKNCPACPRSGRSRPWPAVCR